MNHPLSTLICCLSLLFIASFAQAEVFKWVDKNGQVHYSDKKPENQSTEEIKIRPRNQAVTRTTLQNTEIKDPKPMNSEERNTKSPCMVPVGVVTVKQLELILKRIK